jgi:hypothetical protein
MLEAGDTVETTTATGTPLTAPTTNPTTTEPAPARRARNRAPKAAKPKAKAETANTGNGAVYLLLNAKENVFTIVPEAELVQHAATVLGDKDFTLVKAHALTPTITFAAAK